AEFFAGALWIVKDVDVHQLHERSIVYPEVTKLDGAKYDNAGDNPSTLTARSPAIEHRQPGPECQRQAERSDVQLPGGAAKKRPWNQVHHAREKWKRQPDRQQSNRAEKFRQCGRGLAPIYRQPDQKQKGDPWQPSDIPECIPEIGI